MKRRNSIFGALISAMFLLTSCADQLEDLNMNSEQSQEGIENKGMPSSMKFFHGTKKFRGVNISLWTYESELDKIIDQTGANILRLSLNGALMSGVAGGPDGHYPINEQAITQLHRILNWAVVKRELGKDVRIIIDPHSAPGFTNVLSTNPNDPFWQNKAWRKHLIRLWVRIIDEVASRHSDGSEVAGYDLLNEPNIPDPLAPDNNQWNTLVKILVDTIRAKGDMHPIIVQPAGSATETAWRSVSHLVLPVDDNLVVSSHYYYPHGFTHQGVPPFSDVGVRYPGTVPGYMGGVWNYNRMDDELDFLRDFASDNPTVPILIGEFSVSRAAGPDGDVFLNDFLQMAEGEGWHWAYHAWDTTVSVWHPELHYVRNPSYLVTFSNNPPPATSITNTAPRLNLIRQFMYLNYDNYPSTDEMFLGLY